MARTRKIEVEIIGDSRSVERAFKRAGGAADSFQGRVSTATRGLGRNAAYASGALAGLAVVAGVKAVNAASNLGEQINKTSVVFGKSSGAIRAWAQTTAASIGVSNRAALEAAGTFGNMLVPMGIARDDAAKMSKRMVQLAADMASFNNASPEETLDALRAGLAGETEPLRRFGVFLSADRIKAEALSKGIVKTTKDLTKIKLASIKVDEAQRKVIESTKKYGVNSRETQKEIAHAEYAQDQLTKALKGTVPTLTAQQKAQATYSILLKDTVDAQGDFKRTSDSLPNLLRSIRASVEDLSAAFGEGLLPVVQKAGAQIQKRLADPAFRERLRELGRLIGEKLLKAFEAIADWFSRNWNGIKAAFREGAELARKFADVTEDAYEWLRRIASVTPGGGQSLMGLLVGGVLLSKLGLLNKALLVTLRRLRLIGAANAGTAVAGGKGGKGGVPFLPLGVPIAVVAAVVSSAGGGTQQGDRSAQYPLTFAAVRAAAAGNLGPHALKIIKEVIGKYSLANAPAKRLAEAERRLAKLYEAQRQRREAGPYGGPRAKGGPVMPGVSYTVGERGPETFVPSRAGTILPNGSGGRSSGDLVLNIDGREVARVALEHLERMARNTGSQQRGRFGGQSLALG